MNIWLVKDGENLPIQTGSRKMRMWMLAERLIARGHSVVWWSSTFSHQARTLLYQSDVSLTVQDRLELRLLHANAYRRNVSWARYRHHRVVARRFGEAAAGAVEPDVIVCAFPTVELAYEAAKYADRRGVPSIIDVRDLWPDVIVGKSAPVLRPVVRLGVTHMAFQRRWAFRHATSLVATSENYLAWAAKHRGTGISPSDRVFLLGAEMSPVPAVASTSVERLTRGLTGKTVFAYIGSFGKSYELMLLIEAARRVLAAGNRGIHFVLAGDGEQFKAVQDSAKDLPNVTLAGWLDQGELAALLHVADVGLVPCISVAGTIPNKVFDYLAAGLPVISSLEGEMARIIDAHDIGFSYRCGDVDAFCRAAIALDTDPALRHRQAVNSGVLYATHYQADAIYGAYAQYVETVGCRRQ